MKRLNVIFGILLIACVGIGGVPSSAPRVLAADGPDPATLLQQSIATMKGSLHTARSAGKSTITASGQKAAFTITGTCALTGTRLNAQLHLKGTTIGQKKPVALNEQDGLIWSQSPGWVAVFTRPAGQGKAWQSIDPFDSTGAGMFGLGCPLITVAQMEQQPPANLTLLGPATIGTEAAWHLRSTVKATGSTQTINLYIGQQSLFLLRVGATVNASQLKQTSTMDYSAFNDPVTIALPSVTPLPGRALHTAVRLSDGRVLVLGGVGLSSEKAPIVKAWTEVYDPSTGTWSQAGSLPAVPIMPSIAVAGGGGVLMSAYFYPTSAATNQQFDQTTNTWINAPKSLVARLVPVAAALKDGRVLLAGGYNVVAGQVETSAEIYDPVAGTWTKTGNLNESRAMGALSALLKDGRLLVMGGTTNGTLSAEIYNPAKGTWKVVHVPEQLHVTAMWTLPSGKVLEIGPYPNGSLATTTYDPTRDTYTSVYNSPVTTDNYAAVLLKNGKLLVAGGVQTPGDGPLKVLANAWLFDPKTDKWSLAGNMTQARTMFTMTVLNNGKVLAAGGFGSVSKEGPFHPLSSAEIYNPSTGKWSKTGAMK